MENNDAIFAVDADEDTELRINSAGRRALSRRALREAAKANKGPTENSRDEETTPLLSRKANVSTVDDRRQSDSTESSGERPQWTDNVEFSGLPWWKRPSIFWLLPPFLLFTLAFGGIVVPKLNLILTLICRDYYAEQQVSKSETIQLFTSGETLQCQTNEVSSRVSLFLLYGNLCSGLLAAITSPLLGALSDRYGRKKLLILTTFGLLAGEAITAVAAKYPDKVDVNWILVGYAVDGLCGSFIVGMALVHSYAADCTPPQKRNVAFGYFHACLFTGIAIGPILAAEIIKLTHTVLSVFYIAICCHLFFILCLLLVIPESLSKARQTAAREKHKREIERQGPSSDWVNQLRSLNLLAPLKILYPRGPGSSPALRRNLIVLAAVDTIVFSVAMGAMGVVIIYTNLQFGWGNWESSKFVSIVSACRVFCLMIVLPVVTRLVRGPEGTSNQRSSGSDFFDLSVIRLAIVFDMLGYLGYTLTRDGSLFVLSGAVAAMGGIGAPAIGSALTKHVPADRTGQLLGATGLLHAIARVIGPTIFNGIYYATVGKFRQTVFLCLTATFGLAFLCSWFVRPHVYLEDPDQFSDANEDQGVDESVIGS
ncbi:MFS general substrate transporter [Delitschia confertaspora ATCC 74209]|uniref:MFS general substrate transporter n=1 Tax=Delitschia confertaspora ATCC 74209 TaxID=1513339 RepID=A0A9P4JIU3_9PLEO|nr:MFS general substrate transporter [Delitschia confertaspora ATCC 74209]